MTFKQISEIIKYPAMGHCSGSIGYLEKQIIGQLIMILQPELIIETGTFQGQTTRFIKDFVDLNGLNQCRIATFDLPDIMAELKSDAYFKENPSIELVTGRLPESLNLYLKKNQHSIDLAIVDAQHTYKSVLEELRIIDKWLRKGGYIFCHDYRENDPKYEGVVFAVNRFAHKYGYNILPLNESTLNDREVVWGTALLRKPVKKNNYWDILFFRLRVVILSMASRVKTYIRK